MTKLKFRMPARNRAQLKSPIKRYEARIKEYLFVMTMVPSYGWSWSVQRQNARYQSVPSGAYETKQRCVESAEAHARVLGL